MDSVFDGNNAVAGGKLIYTLDYYNNSSSTVNDVKIKIFLPFEVVYLDSSLIQNSYDNNVLDFNIGNINGYEEGSIIIEVKVSPDVKKDSILAFGATLSYNDVNNKLHSIDNYNSITVNQGMNFMASLISNGQSILGSIWFWILLLILAFVMTWTYRKKLIAKPSANQTSF